MRTKRLCTIISPLLDEISKLGLKLLADSYLTEEKRDAWIAIR